MVLRLYPQPPNLELQVANMFTSLIRAVMLQYLVQLLPVTQQMSQYLTLVLLYIDNILLIVSQKHVRDGVFITNVSANFQPNMHKSSESIRYLIAKLSKNFTSPQPLYKFLNNKMGFVGQMYSKNVLCLRSQAHNS